MKICIIGAGKLGEGLAETLIGGGHDITVVDKNESLLQTLTNRMDIMTVTANVKDIDVLKDIHAGTFDALVVAASDDELNIFVAASAKKLGCEKVIARVCAPEHAGQTDLIAENFGIDFVVNPDMICAEEGYRYLTEKYNLEGGHAFTGGAEILEFEVRKKPQLTDLTVAEAKELLGNVIIAAISRSGAIIIPGDDNEIREDDFLYIVGIKADIDEIAAEVRDEIDIDKVNRVMIAGGGKTGYYLAEKLLKDGIAVRIIEASKTQCEYLAGKLEGALVICGDATDQRLLLEENLDQMDGFAAFTESDEANLLASVIANEHGVCEVVSRISRRGYDRLTGRLGVAMTVNPTDVCIFRIYDFLKGEDNPSFKKTIQGQAQFFDVIVESDMPVANKYISDIPVPDGVLITAVVRSGETIIPKDNTKILPGDKLILITLLSKLADLETLTFTKKNR